MSISMIFNGYFKNIFGVSNFYIVIITIAHFYYAIPRYQACFKHLLSATPTERTLNFPSLFNVLTSQSLTDLVKLQLVFPVFTDTDVNYTFSCNFDLIFIFCKCFEDQYRFDNRTLWDLSSLKDSYSISQPGPELTAWAGSSPALC